RGSHLAAAFIVAQLQVATGDGSCSGITRGRHFVLAFNHVSNYDVTKLSLIVVAFSDQLTTVTISSRYLIKQLPYEKTFEIEARGSLRATLPSELLLGTSSERTNRVIAVDADRDVSTYGLNYAPFTTDAFLGIPVDNLGVSHVAMSYQNDGDNDDSSLFAIVGVEDDTSVSIVLTAGVTLDGVSYQGGDSLEININKYEVVQLVANSNAEYIGGSTIESDNPIAVFTGHLCASTPGSYCDALSEQLVPVESWGTQYIYTATGTPSDRSVYTIYVHYSDRVVSVPTVGEITLQTGQFWQGELVGSGIIKSNKPVSVLQLLRTINQVIVDPSIIQVPAEDQYSFIFGFSTPYSSGGDDDGFFNFLNIVVKASESSTILMKKK
ncbi:IgGFc-binding protein-like, partial [Apostichopus japonicus]|uniref:IgGFc-binding protein-like n=1 Tax=Stichopus japonicus TaxID=307972 RepID=UPI003AB24F20